MLVDLPTEGGGGCCAVGTHPAGPIRENGVVRGAALYADGAPPGIGSLLLADHVTVVDNVYDETGARSSAR